MRLDKKGIAIIRMLETEYGSLSNVPDDNPYMEYVISTYGNNRPILNKRIYLRTLNKNWKMADKISKELEMTRAELVRVWVKNYLKNPYFLSFPEYKKEPGVKNTSLEVTEELKTEISAEASNKDVFEYELLNAILLRNIKQYEKGNLTL